MKHDGDLWLSVGKSRTEKKWKNEKWTWSRLLEKLSQPVRTPENYQEYLSMAKAEQDRVKDVGGYIGGILPGGSRKNVQSRQLVTLDADFAQPEILEDIELGLMPLDGAYAAYSTHKHCPEKPRLRFLIPLDRPVSPEEYGAIARKLAERIGMDAFDDSTYQPARLMYWPSASMDGDYLFACEDLPWISADALLAEYPDWRDTAGWPESSRMHKAKAGLARKQGDPLEKPGLLGAFCRTYSIENVIQKFLPDIYIPCALPGRYTYAAGSTTAGLVLYDEGRFAFSNHATDPCGGRLCNAFDLVRLHKFGEMDDDTPPDTAINRLPSYQAMTEFVKQDEECRRTLANEQKEKAVTDFQEGSGDDWMGKLTYTKGGRLEPTLENLVLILRHDPLLRPIVFNRMGDGIEIIGKIPWEPPGRFWRDADSAQLQCYVDMNYGAFSREKFQTALTKVADDRAYHPVRDYLAHLPPWDGIPRVDTLLMDYLGAQDSDYVRAVTRKTLCAAVERVYRPGCKWDTMLVLNGPQGIGKSTLVAKLAGDWYSDSLQLTDTKDKTAAEKLQGYWILEIGELAGMRKAEVETLRSFISRQNDIYRASFGRQTTPHLRQCVFIGTTNAGSGYLRDTAGNRRFWPVMVPGGGIRKVWDLTADDICQIWAEALAIRRAGESLILPEELREVAEEEQREALESDEREGLVREYLDCLLPQNWNCLNTYERREYLYGNDLGRPAGEGVIRREQVSVIEIWCECFGKDKANIRRSDSNEIMIMLMRIGGWDREDSPVRIPLYGPQRVLRRDSKSVTS